MVTVFEKWQTKMATHKNKIHVLDIKTMPFHGYFAAFRKSCHLKQAPNQLIGQMVMNLEQ